MAVRSTAANVVLTHDNPSPIHYEHGSQTGRHSLTTRAVEAVRGDRGRPYVSGYYISRCEIRVSTGQSGCYPHVASRTPQPRNVPRAHQTARDRISKKHGRTSMKLPDGTPVQIVKRNSPRLGRTGLAYRCGVPGRRNRWYRVELSCPPAPISRDSLRHVAAAECPNETAYLYRSELKRIQGN